MKAEKLIFNHSSEGKVIKEISKGLPDAGTAILPAALIVKTINLGSLPRFVISS